MKARSSTRRRPNASAPDLAGRVQNLLDERHRALWRGVWSNEEHLKVLKTVDSEVEIRRVLALDRKVREVAGDDHVIRMQRSRREDGNENSRR